MRILGKGALSRNITGVALAAALSACDSSATLLGTPDQRVAAGAPEAGLVRVRPEFLQTAPLVVESFKIVEYRATCVWACPYLVYAPLIELREPTGRSTVEVVAVEFTLGDRTTGLCLGQATYTPGLVANLNGIYDYLWSNDLILVSLGGQPLPGDVAKAHVRVRSTDGVYHEIEASGPVERMVTNPILPAPVWGGWSCN